MLRLVRNNNPFTVLLLFIFTLVLKFRVLFNPVVPKLIPNHFLYNSILKVLHVFLGEFGYAYTFLAIVFLFLQSIYLFNITGKHKLFSHVTYIPAYVYILLTSLYPIFNTFSETLLLNWLLIGGLDVMFGFSVTHQPRKLIFNAGFLICAAALFQFTALAFFLLLLVAMVMFRPFNIGEWSVALMGFLTPVYFLIGVLFLWDKLFLLHQWVHIGFSISPKVAFPKYLGYVLSCLFLLLVSGVYAMQQNVAMSNIYTRRDWTVISFYLIIAIMVAFITDITIGSAWLITLPALSIIVSHAFSVEKNKWFSNFIFYFSLLFIVFCLWANK